MPDTKPVIRYEDAAQHRADISGWICKTCHRFYGNDRSSESAARWCCATDLPCEECGGRNPEKLYIYCKACRKKHDDARWAALERVEWDGATPLAVWDNDKYFFDEYAVADHIADVIDDGGRLEDVRLVLCEQQEPWAFDMADFLHDDIGEDGVDRLDFTEIDRTVNDWIEKHVSLLWYPASKAIDPETLRYLVEEE